MPTCQTGTDPPEEEEEEEEDDDDEENEAIMLGEGIFFGSFHLILRDITMVYPLNDRASVSHLLCTISCLHYTSGGA